MPGRPRWLRRRPASPPPGASPVGIEAGRAGGARRRAAPVPASPFSSLQVYCVPPSGVSRSSARRARAAAGRRCAAGPRPPQRGLALQAVEKPTNPPVAAARWLPGLRMPPLVGRLRTRAEQRLDRGRPAALLSSSDDSLGRRRARRKRPDFGGQHQLGHLFLLDQHRHRLGRRSPGPPGRLPAPSVVDGEHAHVREDLARARAGSAAFLEVAEMSTRSPGFTRLETAVSICTFKLQTRWPSGILIAGPRSRWPASRTGSVHPGKADPRKRSSTSLKSVITPSGTLDLGQSSTRTFDAVSCSFTSMSAVAT